MVAEEVTEKRGLACVCPMPTKGRRGLSSFFVSFESAFFVASVGGKREGKEGEKSRTCSFPRKVFKRSKNSHFLSIMFKWSKKD